MKKKSVLILNWRDIRHPLAGGAEHSLHEHAKYWSKNGYKVSWVSANFSGGEKKDIVDGIQIERFGSHYTVHILFFINYMLGKLAKPDIFVDCFHFIPFFAPIFTNKPVIALINEPAKDAWFKNLFFPLSLIGYLLEPLFFIPYKKTKFITSAESIKNELVRGFGIKEDNIEIVHHGVTILDVEVKKNKTPTVLYASRIAPDKGIEDAIRAMAILKENAPDFKFFIVGKAERQEYLDKILEMIDRSGIKNNTVCFGFVSQKKKFELMRQSWVLIHPSIREGWGLNVIEANAMETPTIGYNVTGLRDSIVNGKTGILTKKNSPEGLASDTLHLINDPALRNKMGKNAKIWSKKFLWKESGSKSLEIINKSL